MDAFDSKYILSLIDRCKWTLAKTMPGIPHEYIVRDRCGLSDEEFVTFIHAQREHGVPERWGKYIHPYLYLNGYKYWTMGAPIEETTVMNRQRVNEETKMLGAKDLLKDYLLIMDKVTSNSNDYIFYDSIRIKRVASMIRAFTHTEESEMNLIVRDFLDYEPEWIKKSIITDEKFEELKRMLRQVAYKGISNQMLEQITQPQQRLYCIRSLIQYLKKSNELLNAFSGLTEASIGDVVAYQLCLNMYNPVIEYNNEKLYDIITLLLGSTFEKTFIKEELVSEYGYPKETDKELDDWLLDNL